MGIIKDKVVIRDKVSSCVFLKPIEINESNSKKYERTLDIPRASCVIRRWWFENRRSLESRGCG